MPKVAPIEQRKADHIKINLEKDVRSALTHRTGELSLRSRGSA